MNFFLVFRGSKACRLSWSSFRYWRRSFNTVAFGNGFKSSIFSIPSVCVSSILGAARGVAYSENRRKTEGANQYLQEVCHGLSGT